MTTEIKMLLFPIDKYDRRNDVEFIENNYYTLDELETKIAKDIVVLSLSDFQDLCNDQEFDIENYWVTYVRAAQSHIKFAQ